jgi:hypothetical protein
MRRKLVGKLRPPVAEGEVLRRYLQQRDEDVGWPDTALCGQQLGDACVERLLLLSPAARGQCDLNEDDPVAPLDTEE